MAAETSHDFQALVAEVLANCTKCGGEGLPEIIRKTCPNVSLFE